MQTKPLRWLHLDLNSFFASVEQQLQPNLRGKPVAVVPVETAATCAIAASYEAKAFGIKTGTPIWQAKKICKELVCVLAQHEKYTHYHNLIVAEVNRHIPVTYIDSIDEVACKLMDNENEPAQALELAQRIKAGIAKNVGEYLGSSIGIAPNKYLAKVATELQKPNGLVVITGSEIPQRLFGMKLSGLPGIGYNMEKRLHRAGIFDIKTLCAHDPKHLRKIWHSLWGEKMWYMLHGLDILPEETERKSIGHSHVLPPENRPVQNAVLVAQRLTTKAATRLRRLGFMAGRYGLSVRLVNGEGLAYETKCDPAQDNFTFLKILDTLWRDVKKECGNTHIRKISITLDNLGHPDNAQLGLFDALQPDKEKAEKLSNAVDSINKKYGRDSLSIGMMPEFAKKTALSKIAFTRIPDIEEYIE